MARGMLPHGGLAAGRAPAWRPVCSPSATTTTPLTMTQSMPTGIRARLLVGRGGAHRRRVEDDDVRLHAVAQQPPVGAARAAQPARPSSCAPPARAA